MKKTEQIVELQARLERQEALIELLKGQLTEITMLSKIELGDDVIQKISELEGRDGPMTLKYTGGTHTWNFSVVRRGILYEGCAEVYIDSTGDDSAPSIFYFGDEPNDEIHDEIQEMAEEQVPGFPPID
jgi:hypothetical protein